MFRLYIFEHRKKMRKTKIWWIELLKKNLCVNKKNNHRRGKSTLFHPLYLAERKICGMPEKSFKIDWINEAANYVKSLKWKMHEETK